MKRGNGIKDRDDISSGIEILNRAFCFPCLYFQFRDNLYYETIKREVNRFGTCVSEKCGDGEPEGAG